MSHALLTILAAAGEKTAEHSHTVFYLFAGALAVWAVAISALGIARHATFPPSRATLALVVVVSFALVVGTAANAVLSA